MLDLESWISRVFGAYKRIICLLAENEFTYIPVGVVHAIENPGKVDLELIEIQTGSYLGEDDIVRFEDQYGRG